MQHLGPFSEEKRRTEYELDYCMHFQYPKRKAITSLRECFIPPFRLERSGCKTVRLGRILGLATARQQASVCDYFRYVKCFRGSRTGSKIAPSSHPLGIPPNSVLSSSEATLVKNEPPRRVDCVLIGSRKKNGKSRPSHHKKSRPGRG